MKSDFKDWPLKIKLTYILLSCLDYGCNLVGDDNYETRVKKKLKLDFEFDPKRIRSCIDLIQDSESAILSFAKYGLQKFSSKMDEDYGELYLRLYGILNAIYLQIWAIIELHEVLRFDKTQLDLITNKFLKLKVYEIRKVVAAHTINLKNHDKNLPKGYSKNFFRIPQHYLTAKSEEMNAVDGFGNIREYNLYESFLDYNKVAEEILFDCVIKYHESLISSEKERSETLSHFEISGFKNFSYRKLYENDKLQKENLKKFEKQLDKDFGKDRKNVDEILSEMTIEDMQKLSEINIKKMK